MLRVICYITAALSLATAGGYLLFGQNKGLGIFLVLVAVIVCRVLILNIADPVDSAQPPDQVDR